MRLPVARGPLSSFVIDALRREPSPVGPPPNDEGDPLFSDDAQLALYVCFELSYRGFEGVDDSWEWEPTLIAFRNELVGAFEAALESKVPRAHIDPSSVEQRLKEIAAGDDGVSLSSFLERRATVEQFREFVTHRSIYHLREADPHTWVLPRLSGAPKAALVEIQSDEYGDGNPQRMHSHLFEELMDAIGLDARYGAYIDRVPGPTLTTVNLMSVFAMQRRRRGAAMGHLALLEMDSSIPNRRYADGARRLGFPARATRFYDEHVEADSVHEAIAAHDLAGALAMQEPEIADDIVFGAEALAFVESYFASSVMSAWEQGESSLYTVSS